MSKTLEAAQAAFPFLERAAKTAGGPTTKWAGLTHNKIKDRVSLRFRNAGLDAYAYHLEPDAGGEEDVFALATVVKRAESVATSTVQRVTAEQLATGAFQ